MAGPPQDALFDPEPRTGRVRAALERSLKELRTVGALERVDAVRVAALRSLVESYDRDARRRDVSAFAMANAARAITDLFNSLSGHAAVAGGASFDELVAALSTPVSHPAESPP